MATNPINPHLIRLATLLMPCMISPNEGIPLMPRSKEVGIVGQGMLISGNLGSCGSGIGSPLVSTKGAAGITPPMSGSAQGCPHPPESSYAAPPIVLMEFHILRSTGAGFGAFITLFLGITTAAGGGGGGGGGEDAFCFDACSRCRRAIPYNAPIKHNSDFTDLYPTVVRAPPSLSSHVPCVHPPYSHCGLCT